MPKAKQLNITEEKAYKQADYTLRNRNLKRVLDTVSTYCFLSKYICLIQLFHVAKDQTSNLRKQKQKECSFLSFNKSTNLSPPISVFSTFPPVLRNKGSFSTKSLPTLLLCSGSHPSLALRIFPGALLAHSFSVPVSTLQGHSPSVYGQALESPQWKTKVHSLPFTHYRLPGYQSTSHYKTFWQISLYYFISLSPIHSSAYSKECLMPLSL